MGATSMIDHISIAVRDIKTAEVFYTALLEPLGLTKLREWAHAAVGYGKTYPEFWINSRAAMTEVEPDSGVHICLRASSTKAVDAFHAAALAGGGTSEGEPGLRPEYNDRYYAAFICDPDGNRIEAVTFVS
jgi:catechol 2,3-dioxygenase-like lactoylglutathione lyase family enzyme